MHETLLNHLKQELFSSILGRECKKKKKRENASTMYTSGIEKRQDEKCWKETKECWRNQNHNVISNNTNIFYIRNGNKHRMCTLMLHTNIGCIVLFFSIHFNFLTAHRQIYTVIRVLFFFLFFFHSRLFFHFLLKRVYELWKGKKKWTEKKKEIL